MISVVSWNRIPVNCTCHLACRAFGIRSRQSSINSIFVRWCLLRQHSTPTLEIVARAVFSRCDRGLRGGSPDAVPGPGREIPRRGFRCRSGAGQRACGDAARGRAQDNDRGASGQHERSVARRRTPRQRQASSSSASASRAAKRRWWSSLASCMGRAARAIGRPGWVAVWICLSMRMLTCV